MSTTSNVGGAPWCDEWVVHRDAHVLVIDKPVGIAAHRVDAVEVSDVVSRLEGWLGKRPSLLHALDREASGVMVLALDREASTALAQQLERGAPRKHLVATTRRPRGVVHEVVAREGPRLVIRLDDVKHLRRVLADAGAPIAGDRDHGGEPAARLLWHVEEVVLRHPMTGGRLPAHAPMPDSFTRWLAGDTALKDESVRLRDAAARRYALASREDHDVFRLAHGAGDELPGVEVDVYGEFAVVSLASDDALRRREAIFDAVFALGFRGVYAKLRPKQASTLVDTRREEVAPASPVRGEAAPEPMWVREFGVAYAVRLGDGLSTGLFLDQRSGRAWIRAASAGKSVLNLFAYHGAFSVAAIAGGATQTVTVDASGAALDRARENLDHHGVAVGSDHRLVKADAAEWLAACREVFDIVVLDPPSYSTTKQSTFRADRDYRRLAALACRRVASGGVLLASTNLRRLGHDEFRRMLHAAARDAKREVARIRPLPLPLDHPPAPGEPWHLKSERVDFAD